MLATHHLALHEDKVEPRPEADLRMLNGERHLATGPLRAEDGLGACSGIPEIVGFGN